MNAGVGTRRRAAAGALFLVLGAAGCGGFQWAQVTGLVDEPGARAARTRQWRQATLDAGTSGGRSELGLLRASLEMAGATGQRRIAARGVDHFRRAASAWPSDGTEGRTFVVRTVADSPHGNERWLIDLRWAVRELDGGALLAWEGRFDEVVSTLELLFHAAAARQP
jgi:hypothetical protein